MWASEHRRHHKHVDQEEDPYDITKGFFHAHIAGSSSSFYLNHLSIMSPI
jgi:fatty-acid desaturase